MLITAEHQQVDLAVRIESGEDDFVVSLSDVEIYATGSEVKPITICVTEGQLKALASAPAELRAEREAYDDANGKEG